MFNEYALFGLTSPNQNALAHLCILDCVYYAATSIIYSMIINIHIRFEFCRVCDVYNSLYYLELK